MVRLNRTYYLLLNFTSKIFQKIGSFGQNSNKFSKIRSIHLYTPRAFRHLPRQRTFRNSSGSCRFRAVCPHSLRTTRNSPIVNLFILCFRHLPRQRTLRNSSKLRKFHAIRPHSGQITRNLHHLLCFRCRTSGRDFPKIPVNQAKFA